MSMHVIEDLVEDTVHLLDRSVHFDPDRKRDILHSLYEMQARFDTGYTHFRVMDILLKYHFVYKIPLAQYPQIEIPDDQLPLPGHQDWVYENGTAVAYAVNENGIVYLYCDAGDNFWQRLCRLEILPAEDRRPPQQLAVPALTETILRDAEKQNDAGLLKQWYTLFVKAILEGDLSAAEGIPGTFSGMMADSSFQNIRAIAQQHLAGEKHKRQDEDDHLGWPDMKYELEAAGDIEAEHRIRYLLDLKKSPEQLQASYKKARLAVEGTPQKIEQARQKIDGYLRGLHWTAANNGQENQWTWYKDLPDEKYGGPGHRLFILLELDIAEKTLFCKQALQHSLLLRWQKKQAGTAPHEFHFFYDITAWLPADWTDKNKKFSRWGSWKFDVKQPDKALAGVIDNLIEGLELLGSTYFDFILSEFPEIFFTRDADRLLYVLEEGEDGTGIIPRYVLFDSRYVILLVSAMYYAEKGETEKAASFIQMIREGMGAEKVYPAFKAHLDAVINDWSSKKKMTLPPLWHMYLYKHLKTG